MSAPATRAPATLLATGVLLVSFNLRIPIVGLGPLLEQIRADTGMSSAAAGLLGTLPFLCMALFSLLGAPLLASLGPRRVIAGSLAALALGTVVRAAMPGGTLLIVATLPIGIALALAGIALPSVVKVEFPNRAGGMTGSYTAAQRLGVAAASLLLVPLAGALGGWREAVAATAAPVLVALAVWRRVTSGARDHTLPARRLPRPARRTLLLAAVFGVQSLMFAGLLTWVAAAYQDAGWTAAHAGAATGILMIVGIPASLVVPALTDGRDRRPWVAASAALDAAGIFGIAFAPTALPWLWLTLFALGNGALFPLSLTMPLDVSEDSAEVADAVAWTLGLGYLFSASAPVGVGALRDLSGSFTLPFALLAALAAAVAVLALVALPRPARR